MDNRILIVDFINKGGAINWVITSGYILWAALLLDRGVFFLLTCQNKRKFYNALDRKFKISNDRQTFDTESFYLQNKIKKKGYLSLFFNNYVKNINLEDGLFSEVVLDEEITLLHKHEKRMWILSETGHLSPLLGLLGTVTGLIKAFAAIAVIGAGAEVSDLASGIWEAMLTTANGLILAIVSFISHKLLDESIDKRERFIERLKVMCDVFFSKASGLLTADGYIKKEKSGAEDEGFSETIS